MSPRKLVGAIGLAILLCVGIAARFGWPSYSDDWETGWRIIYAFAMCAALLLAFYDRRNFPKKTWDFNPRRGLLYFCLGWVLFPVLALIRSVSGAEFTSAGVFVFTLLMSVLIGVFGTFTENVGV